MPSEYRAANMIFLGASLTALAFLQAEHLFAFAVVLLDFPADGASFFHGHGGILRKVIGGDVFRAVGRRHPEQFDLIISWESVDFDELSPPHFVTEPFQFGNGLVGRFALTVIHLTVGFERAIKDLSTLVDMRHQILGGVPGIHEDGAERQVFAGNGLVEHVPHVVEFGLAVPVWIIEPPIDDPVFAGVHVDIHAIDDTNAFDDSMFVAAILAPYQFHLEGVALVQDRIVEYQAGIPVASDKVSDGLPDGIWRHVVIHQVTVYGIMRENRLVLGHVGLRVVDLGRDDELAIIPTRRLYSRVIACLHKATIIPICIEYRYNHQVYFA